MRGQPRLASPRLRFGPVFQFSRPRCTAPRWGGAKPGSDRDSDLPAWRRYLDAAVDDLRSLRGDPTNSPGCDPRQIHMTRRDCSVPLAGGRLIHWLVSVEHVWVVWRGLPVPTHSVEKLTIVNGCGFSATALSKPWAYFRDRLIPWGRKGGSHARVLRKAVYRRHICRLPLRNRLRARSRHGLAP